MTTRSLLLKSPFLDIWISVLLLSLAYAVLWWLAASDLYLGLLVGPWTDVEKPNVSLGDAAQFLNRPSLSSICEYLRFNADSIVYLEITRDGEHCPILRFLSEGDGIVVDEKRSADPSIIFSRDFQ